MTGPYACTGKHLAYNEMRYTLARLVLAFDMEFSPTFDIPGFLDGLLAFRTSMFEKPLIMRFFRRSDVGFDQASQHSN